MTATIQIERCRNVEEEEAIGTYKSISTHFSKTYGIIQTSQIALESVTARTFYFTYYYLGLKITLTF